jgi:hypothetical protein
MKEYVGIFCGVNVTDFKISPRRENVEWWVRVQVQLHKMYHPNSKFFTAIYRGKKIFEGGG